MSTSAEQKVDLSLVRSAWNSFRELFNPAITKLAAHPEQKAALAVLTNMADIAITGAPVIRKAIDDLGGLDPVPAETPAEKAKADELASKVAALFQQFENETELQVLAVTVQRGADGKVIAGDVTVVR